MCPLDHDKHAWFQQLPVYFNDKLQERSLQYRFLSLDGIFFPKPCIFKYSVGRQLPMQFTAEGIDFLQPNILIQLNMAPFTNTYIVTWNCSRFSLTEAVHINISIRMHLKQLFALLTSFHFNIFIPQLYDHKTARKKLENNMCISCALNNSDCT